MLSTGSGAENNDARKFLAMTAVITSGVIATAFLVQSLSSSSAQTPTRQLPEYTASGELVLPKNFHEWVYVGSPLTPNALNGGTAGFPEYHNVYIEPGSYAEPRRFADRAIGEGLFPRSFQRRRCDGQGFQAFCGHPRVGLLQFQSP
jgi:hypothetical protein